ncbi:MAG: hypothetical protein ABFD77_00610 [Thermotogota bacterium]
MVSTAASGIKNVDPSDDGALSRLGLGIDLAPGIGTIVPCLPMDDKESA